MADFTTWDAAATALKNDLNNGSFLTKSYSVGGRSRTFVSPQEAIAWLTYMDMQASAATRFGRQTFVQFERPTGAVE